MEKLHLVSSNYKTRWSVNFPIADTCQPTSTCYQICYARHGRLAMRSSLSRQQRVYEVFYKEDPEEIARVIAEGYRRKKLTFLRWCGVGDLTPQAIKVINILGTKYPDTRHKIVTRKVDSIRLLARDMPNVYIMFSLDDSRQSKQRKQQVDKLKHPRVYYSYLRQRPDEDTMGASIIFDMHSMKGKLPWDPKRSCPVDAGRMEMENACEKCKKCFRPEVYDA